MMTADQAREEIRSPLDLLVRHHVDHGAPRMRAYERVASQIGRTPAWVQRVLGRRGDATVGLHDALNIRAAYDRLCARVEAAADAVEKRNVELRRDLDAARDGDRPMDSRPAHRATAQATAAGGPGPAPVPAPAAAAARPARVGPVPAGDLSELPLWRRLTEE